jgi:hypothetical protein
MPHYALRILFSLSFMRLLQIQQINTSEAQKERRKTFPFSTCRERERKKEEFAIAIFIMGISQNNRIEKFSSTDRGEKRRRRKTVMGYNKNEYITSLYLARLRTALSGGVHKKEIKKSVEEMQR